MPLEHPIILAGTEVVLFGRGLALHSTNLERMGIIIILYNIYIILLIEQIAHGPTWIPPFLSTV